MSGIQGSPDLPIWHLEYWCLSTRDSNTWIKVFESNTHHSTSLSSSLSLSGGQQREIIVSKSDTSVLITDYSPSKVYTFSVIAVSGNKQSRPLQGRFKGWFILYSCFIFSQIFSAFLLMTSLLLVFFLPSAKPYSVMRLTPISSSYPSFQFSLLLSCLDFFSFPSSHFLSSFLRITSHRLSSPSSSSSCSPFSYCYSALICCVTLCFFLCRVLACVYSWVMYYLVWDILLHYNEGDPDRKKLSEITVFKII